MIIFKDLIDDLISSFKDVDFGEDSLITSFYYGCSENFEYSKKSKYSKFVVMNVEFYKSKIFFMDSYSFIDDDGFLNIEISINTGNKKSADDFVMREFLTCLSYCLISFIRGEDHHDFKTTSEYLKSDLLIDSVCFSAISSCFYFETQPFLFISQHIKRYLFNDAKEEYNDLMDRLYIRMIELEPKMVIMEE